MAYLNLAPTLKNTRSITITTALGGAAYAMLYSGVQPTDPSTTVSAGTLLAALPMSATAGSSSGGVWTAGAITTTNASSTGTAGWLRLAAANTAGAAGIVDMDVATSGATATINTTSIVSGGPVVISSIVITEA